MSYAYTHCNTYSHFDAYVRRNFYSYACFYTQGDANAEGCSSGEASSHCAIPPKRLIPRSASPPAREDFQSTLAKPGDWFTPNLAQRDEILASSLSTHRRHFSLFRTSDAQQRVQRNCEHCG